ncbi:MULTISPECIES: MlaE family ABC transporter permease [Nitrosomonas]|uniref:Phospholipid/cholesterol/gamma-HCH transport system permease protein n=2 Tax=Nitrosomonas communis TaxID=44574 RepID=A0A1H2WNB7_9PROT|nr:MULTISPECIES: ABC transporter permease [Nitrosomonas]TYP86645.1 phospholipid/cholesterol/gamma-HCH transport system permease protein [Nitrosomonas communis]UVS62035.1 ABC transporter permease [Nitrosomonas sp. PLL12]SDW82130.1 phospholipid/cholesterol/gamma-HCH transport system permease protein [Nitrosomonas communis]
MLPSNRMDDTSPWYQITVEQNISCIKLTGSYTLAALDQQLQKVGAKLTHFATQSDLHWDLTSIQQMDHAGAVLIWRAWKMHRPANLLIRPEHERLFAHLEKARPAPKPVRRDILWPILTLGKRYFLFWDHLTGIITLLGQVLLNLFYLVKHPNQIPLREISANLFRTGAQALSITALVGFLIGIVLSYLSSEQLHSYGADTFIINILGMSIVRELGPMLAAILVAGRSGSSMTAQLGVMRVTEELDALTVMGIPHSLRLVLPKIIGLGIAMPLVVLWTSAIALLGGILAADLQIGLNYKYALSNLPDAVPVANLWIGMGKGVVCGMAIALIACHFGLRIKPNTESLGEGTTNSVVTSITAVILIDAIFAVIFSNVGLKIRS